MTDYLGRAKEVAQDEAREGESTATAYALIAIAEELRQINLVLALWAAPIRIATPFFENNQSIPANGWMTDRIVMTP